MGDTTTLTTKHITSVDEIQAVDNTDKVFVNDNGEFKQVSISNLMKRAPAGITQETDPTVSEWAKQPTKPSYTADEVGALPVGTKIPAKTSDLTNDSGYLTQVPEEYVTETELGQKGYITEDDIPEKLPSPGTLTFTGAVNDTYDGSTDKTINIPTGGSEGGTSDYNALANKPKLNGVEIVGNKTSADYKIVSSDQGAENNGKFLGVGADGNVTPVDKPTYTANEVGARPNTWTPSAEDVGALPNDTEIPSKTSDLENDSGFITGTDIPKTLPNPQKLKFTGAVTAEYDGSTEQTINIPTGGGSGGGTTDYTALSNKPQINGVTLTGNKTSGDLKLQSALNISDKTGSDTSYTQEVKRDASTNKLLVPASGGTVDPEQIEQAVNGYLEENPVSGMTAEQEQQLSENTDDIIDLKSANDDFVVKIFNLASSVENVFKNVVFKSANTESFDYLSNLVQNLKPSEMVTIKYSLTNCTIDNNVAHIMKGSNFTATVTPDSGTEFQSLKVTMGGADVTETVVTDKTINISNVTGDIIITAVSKQISTDDGYEFLNYVYSSGNGDAYIDTDWIMTDLKEKIVVGVQLSETNPTNNVAAFLGVNADSAFSSIYTAIELAQQDDSRISVGWGSYQPTANSFVARNNEDLKSKIHYVSLTNGEQKLWEDEDMNVLYTGVLAVNTRTYTMDESKIPPFPLWLFRSNIQDVAYQSANKKTYRSPGVKISCFKVYDGDGILTVNMRAAKRSNDGVVGFYDTVRKRFFENACDTGDLIGG